MFFVAGKIKLIAAFNLKEKIKEALLKASVFTNKLTLTHDCDCIPLKYPIVQIKKWPVIKITGLAYL